MAASSATKSVDKVTLRVMVEKERNKILYAEAGKDFVDALFSFLTLPLGTIARLVSEESNIEAVKFGSISSLYQSVANLDEQYLWSHGGKERLLRPRISMLAYCQKMKLNIDDREPRPHISTCTCGFVKETTAFIISDDLYVMPNVFGTVIQLLQKLEISDIGAFTEQTVDIIKKEVIDILKLSLVSKNPLTDFIFKKKYPEVVNAFKDPIRKATSEGGIQISAVKLVRRKSTGEILFVEAGDDFINFVFSFLTLPLGGVLHMLEGFSSLNCIDNLYKSVTELSPESYFISEILKVKLINPPISTWSQIVSKCVLLNLVNPSSKGEFVKGPSVYMVTVDLAITLMSSFTAISYLNSSNVSLNDVEEKVVRIGLKEGLSILKAWMNSTSGMTNILTQFIANIKDEK